MFKLISSNLFALTALSLVLSGCGKNSSSVDGNFSSSHSLGAINDNEPLPVAGLSSSKYIEEVCHNNTLPYVKGNIESDDVKFDLFCSCMSDWSLENVEKENLHAFALGFHRFNWGYFQRHYANMPKDTLRILFALDSKRHSKEYGINSDYVLEGVEQAIQVYSHCSKSAAPWEYKGTR